MNNTISKLKSLSFYIICIFFLINLFIYPSEISNATKTGILLWYNNILPSIFSFMIIVNILCYSNILNFYNSFLSKTFNTLFRLPFASFFAMLFGMLSGYPLGAKVTSNLLKSTKLSIDEANRTICFANCCGPMFIIGAIGLNMFNNVKYGYVITLSQILTVLTVAFILRFYKKSSISKPLSTTQKTNQVNYSSIINNSIINSIDTILNICGIVTFFCVVLKILEIYKIESFVHILLSNLLPFEISYDLIKSLLYGMLEITNGIYLLSLSNISELTKLLLTSFFINFGGLCIFMQTKNVTTDTNINLKLYFVMKLCAGIIGMIYTYLLLTYIHF